MIVSKAISEKQMDMHEKGKSNLKHNLALLRKTASEKSSESLLWEINSFSQTEVLSYLLPVSMNC